MMVLIHTGYGPIVVRYELLDGTAKCYAVTKGE